MTDPDYDPHLVLHKVRGEARFDIAEPLYVDGETYWLIPTSGHRAHPLYAWPLYSTTAADVQKTLLHAKLFPQWHDLPDHYTAHKPRPSAAACQTTAPRPATTTEDIAL
jgi:hypothetical protein